MTSSCPFESNYTTNVSPSNENDSDRVIPISPHLKTVTYGENKYILLSSYISPYHMIATGLLASLFLPTVVIAVISLIFFIYPLIRQILRHYNYLPTPYSNDIIRTKYSARYDGDFVVFLIGIRPNGANPFTKSLSSIGKGFQSMVAELEADPELGYMGGDMYIGANSRKSTTMHVQYWRSYESLQKWTHTRMGVHVKTMLEYMKKDQFEGTNGIWHETYKVRDGEYEAVYGNMPPIGLALATQAVCETKMNNGPGRMQRRTKEKEAQSTVNTCTKQ